MSAWGGDHSHSLDRPLYFGRTWPGSVDGRGLQRGDSTRTNGGHHGRGTCIPAQKAWQTSVLLLEQYVAQWLATTTTMTTTTTTATDYDGERNVDYVDYDDDDDHADYPLLWRGYESDYVLYVGGGDADDDDAFSGFSPWRGYESEDGTSTTTRMTTRLIGPLMTTTTRMKTTDMAWKYWDEDEDEEPDCPPPPPGFEGYKKNAANGGVMSMIEQIINDAKAMEAEAIRDAQKAYEDFVNETNASIEAKSKDIVNKSETKAKTEGDLVEAQKAMEAAMLELEQLSDYNAQLHQSCDFVLENFKGVKRKL